MFEIFVVFEFFPLFENPEVAVAVPVAVPMSAIPVATVMVAAGFAVAVPVSVIPVATAMVAAGFAVAVPVAAVSVATVMVAADPVSAIPVATVRVVAGFLTASASKHPKRPVTKIAPAVVAPVLFLLEDPVSTVAGVTVVVAVAVTAAPAPVAVVVAVITFFVNSLLAWIIFRRALFSF